MRLIAIVEDRHTAQKFTQYLCAQGISALAEPVRNSMGEEHAVWVQEEDHVQSARRLWEEYVRNPEDVKFKVTASLTSAQAPRSSSPRSRRRGWFKHSETPWLTYTITGICVCFFLIINFQPRNTVQRTFMFFSTFPPEGESWYQLWRLWTPALLHQAPLHLFFNLWWWWDLGRAIEGRKGWITLMGLLLITAACGNVAEYYASGPRFLGLSGVIYGLLGYLWARDRYWPQEDLQLNPGVVQIMMVWFVLCWTGLLGPVANWCHTGGLIAGAVVGRFWK